MDVNSPQFQDQFNRDARNAAAARPVLKVQLNYSTAMSLLATIQLALRHPGNTGTPARLMRQLAKDLLDYLAPTETLRAGLLAGDNPVCDVPTASAPGSPVMQTVRTEAGMKFARESVLDNRAIGVGILPGLVVLEMAGVMAKLEPERARALGRALLSSADEAAEDLNHRGTEDTEE